MAGIGPSGLVWSETQKKVGDLREWDRNPRRITDEQAKHLAKSIIKFGYADTIVVNTDDTIVGGHMRIRVMKQAGLIHDTDEITVRVPSRELTPEEFEELAIRLNKNTGTWDWDIIAQEFDQTQLREWGFSPMEFGMQSKDLKETGLKPGTPAEKVCPACGAILP
jgi:site-specific DNA-methyltransferase (adenine-specific)